MWILIHVHFSDGDASAAEATVFFIGIFATMYQDLQADVCIASFSLHNMSYYWG